MKQLKINKSKAFGALLASIFSLLLPISAYTAPRVEHVVIISIDGGKPDVIKKSQMPNLLGLVPQSAVTWNGKTVDLTITLPSHTSMLTGVSPKTHKITWNSWDAGKGVVKYPTIFGKAKNAGYSTVLLAAKEKFKHLNVPNTLDVFALPNGSSGVAQAAAKIIIESKPNLLFAHLPEADTVGHKSGWGSSKQKQALKVVDQAIGTIMQALVQAGIENETVIIVTADHGGTGFTHGLNISSNYTIPWIAMGKGVEKGKALSSGIKTVDTAATALWLLDIDANGIEGRPVTSAFNFAN